VTWIMCELKAKEVGGNECSRGNPKITANRDVVFCQKLLHAQGRVGRAIVVVKEPIAAAPHFWSFFFCTLLHNLFNTSK